MAANDVLLALALAGSLAFAVSAVHARRLLTASLSLAGTSALLACALFILQAPYVAAIELSVGAGLVSVLFVFTIASLGNDSSRARPALSRWFAAGLAIGAAGLLSWLALGAAGSVPSAGVGDFARTLWEQRGLDTLGQIVLLFVAALSVPALIGRASPPEPPPTRSPDASEPEPQPEVLHA